MHVRTQDDDQIALSLREIAILTALADHALSGLDIARKCAEDAEESMIMSHGTLYPALKRLQLYGLIQQFDDVDLLDERGRARTIYSLTDVGVLVLGWEIQSLERLARHAVRRLTVRS